MGSPPCTRRRLVPTRVWKALLKALLPTLGLPKVMHRMSAIGYCSAAHVAPVNKTEARVCTWSSLHSSSFISAEVDSVLAGMLSNVSPCGPCEEDRNEVCR